MSLHIVDQLSKTLCNRLAPGFEHKLRRRGRLVWRRDTGEIRNRSRARLGIVALGIALLAFLCRGGEVDLVEQARVRLADAVAVGPVGRDESRDDKHAG